MAITLKSLRRDLYDLIPGLGFFGTADSVSTTSVTDAELLRNPNYVAQQFGNMTLFRPTTTGSNREKPTTTLAPSTGALSHGGANYSDTTETEYEIMRLITPTETFNLLEEVMEELTQETLVPLTLVTDGDMGASNTSSWTATNAALSKVTTAGNVFTGQRSLLVQPSSSNGHAQSASIRVTGGTHIFVSTICRAESSTARLALYDVTNATEFGTAVTHDEMSWQRLWRHEAVPATCKEVAIRVGGVDNGDDVYFDHVVTYRMTDKVLTAPSWLDESFRLRKLRKAYYTRSAANHQDDAMSQCFEDWTSPGEFSLYPFYAEANPSQIHLRRPLPPCDFWIDALRRASDFTTFTNDSSGESATTTLPRKVVTYAWAIKVCEFILDREPENLGVRQALARNQTRYAVEVGARPIEVPISRKVYAETETR